MRQLREAVLLAHVRHLNYVVAEAERGVREMGDDDGLKAAYLGGCPACQNLSPRASDTP